MDNKNTDAALTRHLAKEARTRADRPATEEPTGNGFSILSPLPEPNGAASSRVIKDRTSNGAGFGGIKI